MELRNKLKEIKWTYINYGDGTADEECVMHMPDRAINAVLTAFEEALPEEKVVDRESNIGSENSTPRIIRGNGYNTALEDVKKLIRNNKGAEE